MRLQATIAVGAILIGLLGLQSYRLGNAQQVVAKMEIATESALQKAKDAEQDAKLLNEIQLSLQEDKAERQAAQAKAARANRRILANVEKSHCFTDPSAVPSEYIRVLME